MSDRHDPDGSRLPIKLDWRGFLVSSCAAASTLLAFNDAITATGKTGGAFEIHQPTAIDLEPVAAEFEGREFKDRDLTDLTYGPKTRREFLNLKVWEGEYYV